jgi:hypothetical protein
LCGEIVFFIEVGAVGFVGSELFLELGVGKVGD